MFYSCKFLLQVTSKENFLVWCLSTFAWNFGGVQPPKSPPSYSLEVSGEYKHVANPKIATHLAAQVRDCYTSPHLFVWIFCDKKYDPVVGYLDVVIINMELWMYLCGVMFSQRWLPTMTSNRRVRMSCRSGVVRSYMCWTRTTRTGGWVK